MDSLPDLEKTPVIAYTPNYSTRFLLDVSIGPSKYGLEFACDEPSVLTSVKNNEYYIYIIDATQAATRQPSELFRTVSGLVLRHMIRVVAVADKAPAGLALKMTDFGPLAIVSYDFTPARMLSALDGVMNLEAKWESRKDTGSRVKSDPKFYQKQRFKE